MKTPAIFRFAIALSLFAPMRSAAQTDSSGVPYFSIVNPPAIAGLYQPGQYGEATFGPGVSNGDVVAPVVVPALDLLYCDQENDDFTGKIVLISRGTCPFAQKVFNAESRGAVGVIIWNFAEASSTMGFSGPDTPGIPSIMVPKSIGDAIFAQMAQGETVMAVFSAQPVSGFALIEGAVRADGNDNCVAETGESGRKNWLVQAENASATYFGLTNDDGRYRIFVDTSGTDFTLTALPPSGVWTPCPASQNVNISGPDTLTADFSAQTQVDCPLLIADIGTPFLRRCFENDFVVEICNYGSAAALDAYADVYLDAPGFNDISDNSLPFTLQADGAYRFLLGDLTVDDCAQFTFKTTVSCDLTVIGQTLCYAVHAYPDTLCFQPNAAWSGASVSVEGHCDTDSVRFQIANTGTAAMSVLRDYLLIENAATILQTGQFQLAAGEALELVLPAPDVTYRLEAGQEPNHPVPGTPSATVENCAGFFGPNFLLMLPLYDGGFAEDLECQAVIGSWDPNDKTGYPLGVGPDHLIRPKTELEYRIRFQNTGTDTAFNIVVRDTLSPWLDPATLQPGLSSHPYELSIGHDNQLVFRFQDIRLVDSFTNEIASHGFLTFKIRQKSGNPNGAQIDNRAGIYFDFNPVVLTNTTRHEIGELPSVGTDAPMVKTAGPRIFPNPAHSADVLTVDAALSDGSSWRLFDAGGRLLQAGVVQKQKFSLRGRGLPPGVYWVAFRDKRTDEVLGAKLYFQH